MFMDVPLLEMLHTLRGHDAPEPGEPFVPIKPGAAFMRRFPTCPVVRLRVRPGEAYVAPTENLLHDGSREGRSWLDLPLRRGGVGRWRPRSCVPRCLPPPY